MAVGFFMLNYIYIKFLIIWRTAAASSMLDLIIPIDNMNRCACFASGLPPALDLVCARASEPGTCVRGSKQGAGGAWWRLAVAGACATTTPSPASGGPGTRRSTFGLSGSRLLQMLQGVCVGGRDTSGDTSTCHPSARPAACMPVPAVRWRGVSLVPPLAPGSPQGLEHVIVGRMHAGTCMCPWVAPGGA